MSPLQRLALNPRAGKVFLCALAGSYLIYLVAFVHVLSTGQSASSATIDVYAVQTSPNAIVNYWTATSMSSAVNADQPVGQTSDLTQGSSDINAGKAAQQDGQRPNDGTVNYPISTVGKIFFSRGAGQNYVCSGTAVVSSNKSVVDTAGHCLYFQGGWMQNVIFCPLYENGITPYGCWAARDLEVPADWIDAGPNQFHHDFGMAIVAQSSRGLLTDSVGGAGWAYNQPITRPFNAYGYPAASPFDGQTRQTCPPASGTSWNFGSGKVVSIPCNMTGGSSGGPWFVQINGNWYLNGHNDFTSTLKPGHMFSPYYDDTWYALYSKAQQT